MTSVMPHLSGTSRVHERLAKKGKDKFGIFVIAACQATCKYDHELHLL